MTVLSVADTPMATAPAPPPLPARPVTTEVSRALTRTPVAFTSEPLEIWASMVLTTTFTALEAFPEKAPAPLPLTPAAVTTATDEALTSNSENAVTAELST